MKPSVSDVSYEKKRETVYDSRAAALSCSHFAFMCAGGTQLLLIFLGSDFVEGFLSLQLLLMYPLPYFKLT